MVVEPKIDLSKPSSNMVFIPLALAIFFNSSKDKTIINLEDTTNSGIIDSKQTMSTSKKLNEVKKEEHIKKRNSTMDTLKQKPLK